MKAAMTNFQRRLLTDIPLMDEGVLLSLLMAEPGEQAAEHPYLKELRVKLKPQMSVSADGIADIPVEGALAYRPDAFEMAFLGVEDSRNVLEMVQSAARNPGVSGILLSVDSPGGMVIGGFEIADAVKEAAASKPVVAHVGGVGASLAYLIASQEIGRASCRERV